MGGGGSFRNDAPVRPRKRRSHISDLLTQIAAQIADVQDTLPVPLCPGETKVTEAKQQLHAIRTTLLVEAEKRKSSQQLGREWLENS